MNPELVVQKLSDVAKTIEASKGSLEFFGLFLRDNGRDRWDVVVGAPWLKEDSRESYEYIADQLREVMTREEMTGFSQIVILDHGSAVLESFLERFSGQVGLVDVPFVMLSGLTIRRVYIIRAHPLAGEKPPKKTKKRPR